MTTLAPCPFCGGAASNHSVRDGRRVSCIECGAGGPPKYGGPVSMAPAEIRASTAWNTRPREAELVAALKEARRCIHPHFHDMENVDAVLAKHKVQP